MRRRHRRQLDPATLGAVPGAGAHRDADDVGHCYTDAGADLGTGTDRDGHSDADGSSHLGLHRHPDRHYFADGDSHYDPDTGSATAH